MECEPVRLRDGQVLAVRRWKETFEKSDASKLKHLTWTSQPTGFGSDGLQRLFDDFPPEEAVQMYGVWCFIVKVAANASVRGRLGGSQGRAYSTPALSRMMLGIPTELIDQCISWCVYRSGWLEIVDVDDEVHESPKKPRLPGVSENLRESPYYRTGPYRTEQDRSGRPVAPARPEMGEGFPTASRDRANEVSRRVKDALRIRQSATLTDRMRLVVWRLSCWLETQPATMLDEIVSLIRSSRPDNPDRFLFAVCRARDVDREEFARSWDAIREPSSKPAALKESV